MKRGVCGRGYVVGSVSKDKPYDVDDDDHHDDATSTAVHLVCCHRSRTSPKTMKKAGETSASSLAVTTPSPLPRTHSSFPRYIVAIIQLVNY